LRASRASFACLQAIAVTVSPATVTVAPGGTVQFTATVQNTTNTAVGWGATGGTIDQNGLYTAGSTPGTFSVAAASVEDPNAVGSATVTIASADWSGLYAGTWGQCTGYPVATCYAPTVPWTFRVTRTADRISLYFLEFPWCYPLTLAENFATSRKHVRRLRDEPGCIHPADDIRPTRCHGYADAHRTQIALTSTPASA
jgi:hypothetical protein